MFLKAISDPGEQHRIHSPHDQHFQAPTRPHLLAVVAAVVSVLIAVVVAAVVSVLRRVDAGTKGSLVRRHRSVPVLLMWGVCQSGREQAVNEPGQGTI